jgi:exopolysaccharide biosynthesis polyprenyl glycosylphosphotransferase
MAAMQRTSIACTEASSPAPSGVLRATSERVDGRRSSIIRRLQTTPLGGGLKPRLALLAGRAAEVETCRVELKGSEVIVVGALYLTSDDVSAAAFDGIVDECRRLEATEVVLLAPGLPHDTAAVLAHHLDEHLPVALYVVSDSEERPSQGSARSRIGARAARQLLQPPLTPVNRLFKRASDVVLATIALVLLSPVLLLAAACIKLETRGPIFFRQLRHGRSRKPIEVLKLRTMRVRAYEDNDTTTRVGDVRVTRVGRFLRATNIDELPQLFNVLQGDMSLVGPRPHAVAENEFFETRIPGYTRRSFVKPGITGWAQVNGARGPADDDQTMQRRVQLDLFYIENWSLLLDLKVMWLTVFSPHAYKDAV